MSSEPDPERVRREELRRWLRAKRAAADWGPTVEGFGSTWLRRRRPGGLTQAEVAQLAGVDRRTYQLLEAGEHRPGPEVFDAVVRALRLTAGEVEQLAHLTGYTTAVAAAPPATPGQLRAVLSAIASPALVLDGAMRALAANEAMQRMLPPLLEATYPVDLFGWLFTAQAEEFFADYQAVVSLAVGRLRTMRARAGDPVAVDVMISDLAGRSPRFARLWQESALIADYPTLTVYRLRLGGSGPVPTAWATLPLGPDIDPSLRLIYLVEQPA